LQILIVLARKDSHSASPGEPQRDLSGKFFGGGARRSIAKTGRGPARLEQGNHGLFRRAGAAAAGFVRAASAASPCVFFSDGAGLSR